MHDPYLYEDSDVLKNKYGIKDKEMLDRVEVDVSTNAINEMLKSPILGNFDFQHLCAYHEKIFSEIYEWAGISRIIAMEKAEHVLGYMSIEYSRPENIKKDVTSVLDKMNTINWEDLSLEDQAIKLSENLSDLWKVHPFRDGNTRTTVTFVCDFARSRDMILDQGLFARETQHIPGML